MMKFVITSGGTAGHIYPALAVAGELARAGHQLYFAGTPDGLERRLASEQGLDYAAFKAAGFDRSKPWTLLSSTLTLALSTRRAAKWLKSIKPDAVCGFGGYVSVPVGRAAASLGIPLLIHEQNSAAGWANRYLAKKASAVALTYEDARAALSQNPEASIELTGNPVRRSLLDAAAPKARSLARERFREDHGIPQDAHVLLVFGGSQGARHINQSLVGLREQLMAVGGLYILHITGTKELDSVRAALQSGTAETNTAQPVHSPKLAQDSTPTQDSNPTQTSKLAQSPKPTQVPEELSPGQTSAAKDISQRWLTFGYCDDMTAAYSAADLVVSRAGAGSLAEIAVMRLPAILVPYPYATNDHQKANAQSLVQTGAALMIEDSELDSPDFASTLLGILASIPKQLSMQNAAKALTCKDAAAEVAKMLYKIANTPSNN